ncbi:hypothetical protein DUT91_23245 [Phyllobacterium salinisoli]|uniref:Uncharacterized protein n=1 Tax=Phyllobacterium salinisoli TaxID=1899321 RepID=A0A368JWK8_9HYPH|nr:hypothetical protein [Phyllobacterium salinisoli]RCS21558.1 hypothetical protein DUT91_23245 [Phyllobacterium salinisoli]
MLSISVISPIEPSPAPRVDSLQNLGTNLVGKLRQSEQAIQKDINGALDSSNPLMKMPSHIRELFQRLEAQALPPEQKAMYAAFKKNIIEMVQQKKQFIEQGVSRNLDKVQLELSMKAINKILSSIQQILSSQ